ncbi:hypothetical protein ColTof4_08318 [Colletotrichum tofieldiae]|nr:hypothetical protein ColTof3_02162 [Colletotrichum tofieldiae]GKT75895.1 hypothetical protein ColTof4_08318 [Colletotrichum tofieldiae]
MDGGSSRRNEPSPPDSCAPKRAVERASRKQGTRPRCGGAKLQRGTPWKQENPSSGLARKQLFATLPQRKDHP